MTNLLGEPPETLLPEDPGASRIAAGEPARDVAATTPESTLAWALLAAEALAAVGRPPVASSHLILPLN